MAIRGKALEHMAVRVAAEGMPVNAIKRALGGREIDVRAVLQAAHARGELSAMPAADWPEGSRFDERSPVQPAFPFGLVRERASLLVAFYGLQYAPAALLAALYGRPFLDNPTLRAVVTLRGEPAGDAMVRVAAHNLRRWLAHRGVVVDPVYGRGYRLAGSILAAREILQTAGALPPADEPKGRKKIA